MLMVTRLKFPIAPLVSQMLDQLPADVWTRSDTTFLDPAMGGGQFLVEIQRRLRAAGHSDENIAERMYGCEENILRVNYSRNNKKLVTKNLFVRNIFDHDWGSMKFDVIVGNPPYQDQTGQNTIYPKFYAAMRPLLKSDGHMAMITPPAIIPGLWGLKNPDGIRMPSPIQISKIGMGKNIKNHFPGVGVDICYWHLVNRHPDNTRVPVDVDGTTITASSPLFAKNACGNISVTQSVINKCFSFNINAYSLTTGDHGRSAQAAKRSKDLAVETISQDGTVKTRPIKWLRDHPHLNRPKLMLAMYGRAAVVDTSHRLVSAAQDRANNLTGHNVITVLTNSDQESFNLKSLLESRLCSFFNTATAETRSQYVNFLSNFRGVDISRAWTDQQLYQHFGLTQEEIDLIETTAG